MKQEKNTTGMIASLATGAMVGTAIYAVMSSMTGKKKPTLKTSAKKALKSAEHYIDSMM